MCCRRVVQPRRPHRGCASRVGAHTERGTVRAHCLDRQLGVWRVRTALIGAVLFLHDGELGLDTGEVFFGLG